MALVVSLIIFSLWLTANARRQLLHNYWWQVKEYRLDRFSIFLHTSEGHRRLQTYLIIPKLLILGFAFITSKVSFVYPIIISYEVLCLVLELLTKRLARPDLSIRGKNTLLTSIAFLVISTISYFLFQNLLTLLILDLLSYLIPSIAAAWTIIPYNKALKKELKQANKKLTKVNPFVIGITGSQGKSSTKHFLHDLLSSHHKTIKTPLSHNTHFAIIRSINQLLEKGTKFFLVEMGAYKKGEIKSLTKITPPKIAILTGISPQHLALFGSLENLIKTKYELISSLPKNAPAFINTSSDSTKKIIEMAKKDGVNVYTYALNKKADFSSKITKTTPHSTDFILKIGDKKYSFTTPITVNHLIENLTGALAVSLHLKTPYQKLKTAVANLKTPERAIHQRKLNDSITIIDDSYNSTTPGFEAAINELLKSKTKTIVITTGVLELGHEEYSVHKRLGGLLNQVDHVFLTNPHLAKPILEGLKDKNKLTVTTGENFLSKLKPLLVKENTILLEGRIPAKIKTDLETL